MKTTFTILAGAMLALVAMFTAVEAQPPGRGDRDRPGESIDALEAQLALLKRMTNEVEERLKAARARGGDRPGPRGFGVGGPPPFRGPMGPMGPMGPRGPMGKGDEREEKKEKGDKKEAPRGDRNRELEERIERLSREIEEIRRALRR